MWALMQHSHVRHSPGRADKAVADQLSMVATTCGTKLCAQQSRLAWLARHDMHF